MKVMLWVSLGKYYVTDDRGLNWLSIETGYIGSYWSGIKVDEGQSLLLGMSGNITLATLYDLKRHRTTWQRNCNSML